METTAKQFTCPQCGGHSFGRDAGTDRVHCNSTAKGEPLTTDKGKPCGWSGTTKECGLSK